MVNKEIFKAYDIRGIYDKDFDDEFAYKLGYAFTKYLEAEEVVVCRDGRISSPKLKEKLVEGIKDAGANAVFIGTASTPYSYYCIMKGNYKAGITITASHNPKEYNGFKLMREGSWPVSKGKGMEEVEKLIEQGECKVAEVKGEEITKNYREEYKSFLKENMMETHMKAVVDQSNGVGWLEAQALKDKIDVKIINSEINGNFPAHGPDPKNKDNLKQLGRAVLEEKADIGIIFDGDADRVMFVDEKGQLVRADIIALLIIENMAGGVIVQDPISTKQIKEEAEARGVDVITSKVGRTNISHIVQKENADFGIETSGHYFFQEFGGFDNPGLMVVRVLNALTDRNKKLSDVLKDVKYHHSGELNFKVEDKDKAVSRVKEKYKDKEIDELDGITVKTDDYWFNLRKSNTEPLIRLNAEADSEEELTKIVEEVKEELES